MIEYQTDFIIAGNINLDIIPRLSQADSPSEEWAHTLVPGRLTEVGPAVISTGGAVSNTGIALARLGLSARLVGKIANDYFGQTVRSLLEMQFPSIAADLIVEPVGSTSYTIVLSPPHIDRLFLHSPGVNDTFGENDIPYHLLKSTKILHFGYPPLMKRMYENDGRELTSLFRRVKRAGTVTSLDMAKPDPRSRAGELDWRSILSNTLPYVDLFLPSFDEILFMLRRDVYSDLERRFGKAQINQGLDASLLRQLSDELLNMGCGVVGIKLGSKGMYLKTSTESSRLAGLERRLKLSIADWTGIEYLAPCFQVELSGTTGSGDCTIAGFLAGLVKNQSPEQTLTSAVAIGACSVENPDATSGIPSWEVVQQRVAGPWPRLPGKPPSNDWHLNSEYGLWQCSK